MEESKVEIKIKTLTGKILEFSMLSDNTILDLNHLILNKEGIPIEQQKLIYNQKQLQDNRKLSDYSMKGGNEYIIFLVLNLKKPVILFYNFENSNLETKIILNPKVWKFYQINPKQIQRNDTENTYTWNFNLRNKKGDQNLLFDLNKNKEYSYIFWEAHTINFESNNIFVDFFNENKKFCFASIEVEEKLDELLSIKGLNSTERQDMITYWLPQLLEKKYVLISFFNQNLYNELAKLEIKPKPRNTLRLFMLFKSIDFPESLENEHLMSFENVEVFEREKIKDSLVIEWGAMNLK